MAKLDDGWKRGIDSADSRWDSYDEEIQRIVSEYNRYLRDVPGYRDLDWKLVKTMIWVETGARSPLWNSNPMQIGNIGDPGLHAVLAGKEGADLIIPPIYRNSLSLATVRSSPIHSIRAGVGYLLMKAARFDIRSLPDPDAPVFEVTVKPNDNIEKIAQAQGSTVEMIEELNPGVTTHKKATSLQPGKVLKCRKASKRKVIIGWRPIDASTVGSLYNRGGDRLYSVKMNYAFPAVLRKTPR